ncbi:MarR family winged helix-turn-helix transcriptional regulator [Streptomyces albus]|uniref:MarR family winged helix-turn-helix transcriptional regulator n=1 Tax=Streptomyces albus TaxID=1888 RepID=UPI003F4CC966
MSGPHTHGADAGTDGTGTSTGTGTGPAAAGGVGATRPETAPRSARELRPETASRWETEPRPETAPRPETEPRSETELLTETALGVFRLNGRFLAASDRIARPAGLTAAWWQVLGAVLREPLPVSGIARAMGITRQSVQRIADLLVERGLAAYEPNPAHRRAKLLTPTDEGRAAIENTVPGHTDLARRLCRQLGGPQEFAHVADALQRLTAAMEALHPDD